MIFKFFRKSQAAMEVLMTYGWAILVVLAAIAALAYFGVLSPEKFLPEKCILSPGLTCVSQKVETSQITLVIANGLGRTITVTGLNVSGKGVGDCTKTGLSQDLMSGDDFTFTIDNNGADCSNGVQKDNYRGAITLSYTEKDTQITKTTFGDIVTKIE